MRVTERQLAEAYMELLSERKIPQVEVEKSFFQYLKRKGLLGKSQEILRAIERYQNEKEDRLPVTVMTARTVDQAEKERVEREAARLFPEKHLLFTYKIDPHLLGGIRIETEDVLYDGTLRRSLRKLAQIL